MIISPALSSLRRSSGWSSNLLISVLTIGLAVASPATALVSFILLALYALSGYSSALKALVLAWLIGTLSSGISLGGDVGGIGRIIVFAFSFLSVFGRALLVRQPTLSQGTALTLGLGFFLSLHSLMFSQVPDVSLLKAVTWTLVMATILLAFSKLSFDEMQDFTRWLFFACVMIMIVSLPLLLTPLGFLRNGRGFQGILSHPQSYGVFIGFLSVWTTAIIMTDRKFSKFTYSILGLSIVSLFLTQARTGGIAFAGGLSTAVILLLIVGHGAKVFPHYNRVRLVTVLLTIIFCTTFTMDWWRPAVIEYLFKGYDVYDFSQLYDSSRGHLIERALENFQTYPFTGVGFGIDVVREMTVTREPFFNLPISAPIEKGNGFVASLEEVGLIVSTLILVWLIFFLRKAMAGGLASLALFCCALWVNVGEAIFFSPGGLGLLVLIFFGWSVHQRLPDRWDSSHG